MLPDNYESLMWWEKLELLDPVRLLAWESMNHPKIVPSRQEAEKIGIFNGGKA